MFVFGFLFPPSTDHLLDEERQVKAYWILASVREEMLQNPDQGEVRRQRPGELAGRC
jgi:hypothetical protein